MSTLSSEQRKELEATYRQLIGAVKAMARLLELPDPIAPRHDRRSKLANTQEAVITIWNSGEWRVWGAMDAHYARTDQDYVVTLPLRAVLDEIDTQTTLRIPYSCDTLEAMHACVPVVQVVADANR